MTHAPSDTEISLSYANQRAVVSPYGASLRRYFEVRDDGSEMDIVWGYSGSTHKRGGQGDVLVPFPGRIKGGRYQFEGASLQLACNDKDGPNAIHGFLRTTVWQIEKNEPGHIEFKNEIRASEYESRGYPFSIDVKVSYRLGAAGLECAFTIQNQGDRNAPVGIGFHPYFTVGTELIDEAQVEIPATKFLEFENLIPTGKWIEVAGTPYDFRTSKRISKTVFNHCYAGLTSDPKTSLTQVCLKNAKTGRRVTVSMDSSFGYLVVYTGDTIPQPGARRALAIEPMTCATDAFNHPEWGLRTLAPGATFNGKYTIRAEFRPV